MYRAVVRPRDASDVRRPRHSAFVDERVFVVDSSVVDSRDAADVGLAGYRGVDRVGEVFQRRVLAIVVAYHAADALDARNNARVASARYRAGVVTDEAAGVCARASNARRVDGVVYRADVRARDAACVVFAGHYAFVVEAGHLAGVDASDAADVVRVLAVRHAEAVGEQYAAAVAAYYAAERRRAVA